MLTGQAAYRHRWGVYVMGRSRAKWNKYRSARKRTKVVKASRRANW